VEAANTVHDIDTEI